METYDINKMVVKIIALLALLILVGCSFVPPILYRIDVQQGNVVDAEMVEKLKLGMTEAQVRFVLGSPLIVDAFRNNRWDYVYVRREKGRLLEQERLTVFFEEEKLINIENHLLTSKDSTKYDPVEYTPQHGTQDNQEYQDSNIDPGF